MLILGKALVQRKLDYCSQLWSPIEKGDIQALEGLQRSFLLKLSGLRNMSYWEQLHHLKLYSVERRRERYLIIYIWRILEEQVPNIKYADGERNKVTAQSHPRRGKECIIPKVSRKAPCRLQKLRDASLAIRGQRLFNALPAEVINTTGCSVDQFKQTLDRFLSRHLWYQSFGPDLHSSMSQNMWTCRHVLICANMWHHSLQLWYQPFEPYFHADVCQCIWTCRHVSICADICIHVRVCANMCKPLSALLIPTIWSLSPCWHVSAHVDMPTCADMHRHVPICANM